MAKNNYKLKHNMIPNWDCSHKILYKVNFAYDLTMVKPPSTNTWESKLGTLSKLMAIAEPKRIDQIDSNVF